MQLGGVTAVFALAGALCGYVAALGGGLLLAVILGG